MLVTLLALMVLSVACNVPVYLMLREPRFRVSVPLIDFAPQYVPVAIPDTGGLV